MRRMVRLNASDMEGAARGVMRRGTAAGVARCFMGCHDRGRQSRCSGERRDSPSTVTRGCSGERHDPLVQHQRVTAPGCRAAAAAVAGAAASAATPIGGWPAVRRRPGPSAPRQPAGPETASGQHASDGGMYCRTVTRRDSHRRPSHGML